MGGGVFETWGTGCCVILLEPLRYLFHNLSTEGVDIEATGSTNNHVLFGIFDLAAKAF